MPTPKLTSVVKSKPAGGVGPRQVADKLRQSGRPGFDEIADYWDKLVKGLLKTYGGKLDDEINDDDMYVVDPTKPEVHQWRQGASGQWHHLATWEPYSDEYPSNNSWIYNYVDGMDPSDDEDRHSDAWLDVWNNDVGDF